MWFKILLTIFLSIYALVEILSAGAQMAGAQSTDDSTVWLFFGRILLFFVALFFCIGMWVWLK
jgi:hypothetical protein